MSVSSLEDMSTEDLLAVVAPPDLDDRAEGFDNDVLLKTVRQKQSDSVDTETGAPLGVRSFVGAAQTQADKLATLQQYYPDAVPVEVFDPENGARKFGRGNFVFTDPETGKLTLFDEDFRIFGVPVPTLRDVADVGPEVAEITGGIAGGTLLAAGAASVTSPTIVGTVPAASAAFVVGEGAGSAAAREAYIGMLDFFGETVDNRSGLERLSDFATTAALNAVAGPIASKLVDGVKYIGGNAIRYASGALSKPAREAYERMTQVISQPTAGQVTGTPLANLMENSVLSNLPTSTGVMRENAQQTVAELEKFAADLAEKYGGARTTSEAAEKTVQALESAQDRFTKEVNEKYGAVTKYMTDDLVSDGRHTAEFVNKYLADSKTATGKSINHPALEEAGKVLQDVQDGVMTFERLKDFRTSLLALTRGAVTEGADKKAIGRIKELIPYVTRDLDNLVEKAGNKQLDMLDETAGAAARKDLLAKYKEANAFFQEKKQKGSGNIAYIEKLLKKVDDTGEATTVLNDILNPSRLKAGDERLKRLKEEFTPEEFEVFSGFMLGKMGTPTPASMGAAEVGEAAAQTGREYITASGFSPSRFLSNWNNLSKEAKNTLFGGNQYKDLVPALDDLVFTVERVGKAASDMANPSGTSRALFAIGALTGLGGAEFAGQSDGFEYGLGGLIAPFAAAKLMTNKNFVKWLAEGVEKAAFNPTSFGQHVRRLVQIAELNPDIRDHVRAVANGLTEETLEPLPTEASSSNQAMNQEADNELRFRQSVGAATADKVLPSSEELMRRADSIDIPEIDADPFGGETIFEPLPEVAAASIGGAGMNSALSPTIVPSDQDRELAMRMQGGIGSIA